MEKSFIRTQHGISRQLHAAYFSGGSPQKWWVHFNDWRSTSNFCIFLVNLRQYTFTEVWIASGRLTQEISNIIFFIVAFIYLNLNDRSTSAFICATIASVTAVLYPILIWILPVKNCMYLIPSCSPHLADWFDCLLAFEEIRSAVIFLATGYFVSPVLCTLTETISTDTIYAMSTLMMLAHLIFYDYGPQAAIVSQPLSLNAAIFAAVCLASRLNNIYVAFALLTLAVDLFVIGSYLRRWIHDRQWENKKSHPNPGGDCGPSSYKSKPSASKHPEMITSLVMGSSSLVALFKAPVLRVYPILLVLLYIFVNLICPYLFYSWQQYKE